MDQSAKDRLLGEAQAHITQTTHTISQLAHKLDQAPSQAPETFYTSESETAFEDEMRARAAGLNTDQIRAEMLHLAESPYFARCDLVFDDEPLRPYYFAKYSASELGIYSWTSPIATLRFETPGAVSYDAPREPRRTGRLERRDQYMIARGHLNFMTTELLDQARELIYQEHFSGRKTGFILPEVVAQMEKAQDQVIRAGHRGPFAISGPAGSGKTTLALHRVAFLRQSPETTDLYPAKSILVLVQDRQTEDYFSHLLPELGIHDVVITTFAGWALGQLGLTGYAYAPRPGHDEPTRDQYEWAKLQALRGPRETVTPGALKYPNKLLLTHYSQYLDAGQRDFLAGELEDGVLDRFDLTLLLLWKHQAEGRLLTQQEHITPLRGGRIRKTLRQVPLEYSLILVDEFQNYLPEQLRLLRGVTNSLDSMLYIGDLAQQTQLGASANWADFGEHVAPERAIKLAKVYRNTRQILEYIRGLGYPVDIPAGVKDGPAVTEHRADDVAEALQYIVGLTRAPGTQLGIIAADPETLETYVDYFAADPTVRCLTMRQAQGVEFDIVCLVGLGPTTFAIDQHDAALAAAQRQVHRDLLYVALTRAMTELHLLGPGDIRQWLSL